ncbi:cytochrome c [Guyparkeria halophila]|uniref:Cytochrome c n=1 Tax=Guyparkeria halophila TaxID=47960 RepID=A0ABZ0YSZ3_9GAMM|nr:cytochrome c [Guyparkeria halophila]WQH15280.1 cytochrome c [Guyparkeria halophila]
MKGHVDKAVAGLMALLLILWLAPALALGTAQASEDEHDHSGVHEFHETMEELGEHTEQIVKAINHEDWQWVAKEARAIAEHPRPPAEERKRIMAFAGDRRAEFQKADQAAHAAAATLADVADTGDGREVIRAFADLQATCLDCHASFRDDFRQHFYVDK